MKNPILEKGMRAIEVTSLKKLLAEKVKGKSVLDVGCAGNASEKGKWPRPNTWLHGKISRLSGDCIGIDIDQRELALIYRMRPELKLAAMGGDAFHFKSKFDVILFNWCFYYLNPYEALACARRCLREGGEIIIGVTNASTILNFKKVLTRRVPYAEESGLFSFDPVFLGNFMQCQGFEIIQMYWAERRKLGPLERIFVRISPYFRQYFLVVVTPERHAAERAGSDW
jgi:SAM-dependent methyltransferase